MTNIFYREIDDKNKNYRELFVRLDENNENIVIMITTNYYSSDDKSWYPETQSFELSLMDVLELQQEIENFLLTS